MSGTALPTDELVQSVVRTLRRVPDAHRCFTVGATEVSRVHRIDAALLERLLCMGLPHQRAGRSRRFDPFDVANIGLLLHLPSPRRMGMRWWAESFRVGSARGRRTYTVRFSVAAKAGLTGDRSLEPRVVAAAVPGSVESVSEGTYTLRASVAANQHYFGTTYEPLFRETSAIQFHLIPASLRGDLGFLAETGLADCKLATNFLVTRGAELGLPVRSAEGLFMARPYAFQHRWIELEEDGTWIAADPFFLQALGRWGIVDADVWPPHRSPQSVLWRLHATYVPLMWNGRLPAEATVSVLADELDVPCGG